MIINYITRKQPEWQNKDIKVTDSLDGLIEMFKNTDIIGADTENNSVHAINAVPLLAQFSDGKESWVVDTTTVSSSFLKGLNIEDKTYIMHNAQYDYMIFKQQYGVTFKNLIDTMIIEQVLGRGSGRSASLEATHFRRLNSYMPVSKSTRDDFTSMKYNPVFLEEHILYSGYDPVCLFPIYEAQKPLIKEYKLEKRIYDIAFPCVSILGDMSLNGFYIDNEKWTKILNENRKKKFEIECRLDDKIREYAKNHKEIRGGIWTNIRRTAQLEQVGLFGANESISNVNKHNVSYSSNKQLTKLFKVLKEPMPEKADKDTAKWEEKKMKVSFAEEALEQYKIQYPSSRLIPFINDLIEYRGYEKAINSFGEIFLKEFIRKPGSKKSKIGYHNPRTGKVHTIYKQEFTKNGRLSSGDVRNGFYNSQQIIKDNRYRNSFTLSPQEIADGWFISTYDLSGAELVILASHSGDRTLIKLIKEGADLHSYLASAIYTKIFKYILENMSESRAIDEIAHLLEVNRLQQDLECTDEEKSGIERTRLETVLADKGVITVNKKLFPDLRNPVKNIVYGINYGAGEEKVAETLNIAPYYAKLALEAMREQLPDAFAYLDRISRFGVKHGYIIFNDRTNSRHWFQTWLEASAQGRELQGKDKSAIGRACKNYGISGTQADMIKESMVSCDKFVQQSLIADALKQEMINNIKLSGFEWLLQVHDELVFKHKHSSLEEAKIFAKELGNVIVNTCNLYLKDIEMKVEGDTTTYWNK